MCEIIFERRKVVVGQLTERVIMQKVRFEAFFEDKVLWENLQNSQENIRVGVFFW